MNLPITSTAAALLTFLIITLALRIVKQRRTKLIGVGDGGDMELSLAMRSHGNAIENVPLALLLLGLLEAQQANLILVLVLAAMLLVGRMLHASGLAKFQGKSFGRFYGTILTWLMMLISALYLLVHNLF